MFERTGEQELGVLGSPILSPLDVAPTEGCSVTAPFNLKRANADDCAFEVFEAFLGRASCVAHEGGISEAADAPAPGCPLLVQLL